MLKKILSVLLSVSIILPSACLNASASLSGRDGDYRIISKEVVKNGENGYLSYRYVDEKGKEITPVSASVPHFKNAYNLPSKYDARDDDLITSVKNQDPFGTCWAFAYCSAAETSLIKQGFATNGNVNISEAHLSWFAAESYNSKKSNPLDGDGMNLNTEDAFDFGGNTGISDSIAAQWSGLAKDKNYRYSHKAKDMAFSYKDKYVSDYQIVSSKTSLYNSESINDVKNAVLRSGSVMCSFGYFDDCFRNSPRGYNYYCPEMYESNHQVVIVGWDDNYSIANFNYKPEKKGAWLIKNSWGTNWGNRGYCWLSYYDMTITDYSELRAVPAGSFLNNYQYDGFMPMSSIEFKGGKGFAANIFTAQENEKITSAAFTNDMSNGYIANVSLYTDLKNPSDPTSGKYRETKIVPCAQYGYYTVDFSDEYSVKPGEKFSIVVEYISNADCTYCSVEGESTNGGMDDYYAEDEQRFLFNFSSKSGQSFMSADGKSWDDTSVLGYNNVPIKAFTIAEKAVKSVKIKTNPEKTEYYEGNVFDTAGLSLSVEFKDGTTKTVRSGFSVKSADLSSSGKKNVTISYGGKSVTVKVKVLPKPDDAVTGIKIADKIKISPDGFSTIIPTVYGGAGDNYTLRYSSSDEDVLYVDSYGNIYGISRGTAEVQCLVTDQYGYSYQDSCTVNVEYNFFEWLIVIFLFGWLWY